MNLLRLLSRCPTCHAVLCMAYATGDPDWFHHGCVI